MPKKIDEALAELRKEIAEQLKEGDVIVSYEGQSKSRREDIERLPPR